MNQSTARKIEPIESDENGLERMDRRFLAVLKDLIADAIQGASQCTGSILELSSSYVQRDAFDTLKKFYDLYFGKSENSEVSDQKKQEINSDVDDLFDAAVAGLAQGLDIEKEGVLTEDQAMRQERLATAALQKELEGLIVLDKGIRSEILPALSSMQFEDATRQRMEHVLKGWEQLIPLGQGSGVGGGVSTEELDAAMRDVAKLTSSVKETEDYYNLVLMEPVPDDVKQGADSGSILLF